jgi:hypothetical protein
MSGLNRVFEAILEQASGVAFAAQAFRLSAHNIGLDLPGAQLVALGHRIRFYARDSLHVDGHVDPTLWLVDSDDRQWAFSADFTSTEDEQDRARLNWNSMRLLLRKLDATAYCLVQETHSVRISMEMTMLEKQAARDDPSRVDHVAVVCGESIDGGGLMLSYRIKDGKIDVDEPFSSIFGRKDYWPGPHGSQFIDHGFAELMPRGGWPK